jgi:hypothetical protein
MTIRATALAQAELVRLSKMYASEPDQPTRHRCFLSHHAEDAEEVLAFVEKFEDVIIPRAIGVTDDDLFFDSDGDDYVMSLIRQKYLGTTTVTVVLLGQCTWARRFVDWEIYSSLRQSKHSTRNGLMSVRLSSGDGAKRPARLEENLPLGDDEDGYARAWKYPRSTESLRLHVEDAFDARTSRAALIKPLTVRRLRNASCP